MLLALSLGQEAAPAVPLEAEKELRLAGFLVGRVKSLLAWLVSYRVSRSWS